MKKAGSFGEQIEHNPYLTLSEGIIEADPIFNVLDKWFFYHFIDHVDHSICAAVAYLHIFVVLGDKDEVGVRIFEDLLV